MTVVADPDEPPLGDAQQLVAGILHHLAECLDGLVPLPVGQILFDQGRLRDAERYFRSFYQYQWMYLVPSHYYLGRIYEELDRPDDAAYHYGLFVEWWRNADPALRPWWEEGRDALARVTEEPRQ